MPLFTKCRWEGCIIYDNPYLAFVCVRPARLAHVKNMGTRGLLPILV
jgi:hypothetical protein